MMPTNLHGPDDIELALLDGVVPKGYPQWFRLAALLGSGRITLDEEDAAILSEMWREIDAYERG